MLGSIYIGLSGMNAFSKGLQTISNNVSNMNTSGYKANSVTFSDMFSQGSPGLSFTPNGSDEQASTGVRVDTPRIDFRQGDLQQTGNALDLAIQGSGFLALMNDGNIYYARTGRFEVDEQGYIVQQGSGYRLAVLDGSNQLTAVNVDAKRTNPPVTTTKIVFADNLSSTATDATVSNIAVFDTLGGKHVWQVKFVPVAATPGQWTATVTDDAGATVGTGTLKFIGGVIDPASAKITLTSGTGAAAFDVLLDFSSGVTSFSSGTVSTIRAASSDGNPPGALSEVTVDANGQVKLSYTNGKTALLGAVAIADFRDPQSLQRTGDGLFQDKVGLERRLVGSGGEGAGRLVSGEVESSNVDLSHEFGELILIQRGFQAASQVVSVSNDMIQQLFAMRGQG
jgi:flagellar hook protein FlgE